MKVKSDTITVGKEDKSKLYADQQHYLPHGLMRLNLLNMPFCHIGYRQTHPGLLYHGGLWNIHLIESH